MKRGSSLHLDNFAASLVRHEDVLDFMSLSYHIHPSLALVSHCTPCHCVVLLHVSSVPYGVTQLALATIASRLRRYWTSPHVWHCNANWALGYILEVSLCYKLLLHSNTYAPFKLQSYITYREWQCSVTSSLLIYGCYPRIQRISCKWYRVCWKCWKTQLTKIRNFSSSLSSAKAMRLGFFRCLLTTLLIYFYIRFYVPPIGFWSPEDAGWEKSLSSCL